MALKGGGAFCPIYGDSYIGDSLFLNSHRYCLVQKINRQCASRVSPVAGGAVLY